MRRSCLRVLATQHPHLTSPRPPTPPLLPRAGPSMQRACRPSLTPTQLQRPPTPPGSRPSPQTALPMRPQQRVPGQPAPQPARPTMRPRWPRCARSQRAGRAWLCSPSTAPMASRPSTTGASVSTTTAAGPRETPRRARHSQPRGTSSCVSERSERLQRLRGTPAQQPSSASECALHTRTHRCAHSHLTLSHALSAALYALRRASSGTPRPPAARTLLRLLPCRWSKVGGLPHGPPCPSYPHTPIPSLPPLRVQRQRLRSGGGRRRQTGQGCLSGPVGSTASGAATAEAAGGFRLNRPPRLESWGSEKVQGSRCACGGPARRRPWPESSQDSSLSEWSQWTHHFKITSPTSCRCRENSRHL